MRTRPVILFGSQDSTGISDRVAVCKDCCSGFNVVISQKRPLQNQFDKSQFMPGPETRPGCCGASSRSPSTSRTFPLSI